MASVNTALSSIVEEWEKLDKQFEELECLQKSYSKSIEKLKNMEVDCRVEISRHMNEFTKTSQRLMSFKASSENERKQQNNLKHLIALRKAELENMKTKIPKSTGIYLKIVLGSVNVNLLDADGKYKYKDEYERFKLAVTIVTFILSFINIFVSYRALDALLHFLLLWYYCTLTIRESILVVNGSRIKGWWRMHHFITTVLAGVLILWPDGNTYQMFRKQFMWYSCYSSFLQFLQFNYQQGCLYRLRALGERYNMDITIDGFHSWMWRGLKFLLPFLALGYFWQLCNAYFLVQVSKIHDNVEWQVPTAAVIFFILFIGNSVTTGFIVQQKLDLKDLILRKFK